jgi:hypothetical protein
MQQGAPSAWEAARNLSAAAVHEWLESSEAPEAEGVRRKRDLELQLVGASSLTFVVSPEEASFGDQAIIIFAISPEEASSGDQAIIIMFA